MNTPCFEWDPEKDRSNQRKHGVPFREAVGAFRDEHALIIPDPDDHSGEERSLLVGMSGRLRILVVCHCLRGQGNAIRLISARRATRSERADDEDRSS